MKNLYIIGGNSGLNYASWILPLGFKTTEKLEEANLCLAIGGEDWHPSWYQNKDIIPHRSLHCNYHRDQYEIKEFEKAINLNIPIVGVCRGSQIMPVLAGRNGKIIQHQSNNKFNHLFKTHDGLILNCTSEHHNAAYPYDLNKEDYELLGWSENILSFRFLNQNEQVPEDKPETEVVFYPKIKSLGFQMHWEWDLANKNGIQWAQKTLIKFLNIS